jgi:excisionase family DNA binding protein
MISNGDIVQKGTVSITRAVMFTSLSRSALYDLMQTGKLRYTKIGRRRLIPMSELERLLAAGMVGGAAAAIVGSLPT